MAQGNFITLACPACGGKQTIKPGSNTVVCEYCGKEYLLSPEIINTAQESLTAAQGSSLKCPACHKDDRIEKVSAILMNQVQQIEKTALQKQSVKTKRGETHTIVVPVSYTTTQLSALAQRLNHPPVSPQIQSLPAKPAPVNLDSYISTGKLMKIISIAIACLTILCVAVGLFGGLSGESTNSPVAGAACLLAIGLLLAAPLWILGEQRRRIKNNPERIQNLEQNYQVKLDRYNQALEEKNQKLATYQQAMENWNNLYYCYRDDCVFVLGKGKSAPVDQLQEYLNST